MTEPTKSPPETIEQGMTRILGQHRRSSMSDEQFAITVFGYLHAYVHQTHVVVDAVTALQALPSPVDMTEVPAAVRVVETVVGSIMKVNLS